MPVNLNYLRKINLLGPQNPSPNINVFGSQDSDLNSSLDIGSLLQPYQNQAPIPQPATQEEDLGTQIQKIFDQYPLHSEATDRYTSLLNQFPERNKPSTYRNILGALASATEGVRPLGITNGQVVGFQGGANTEDAMRAGDLIRYRPYYEKLQDWETRAKPLEQGMTNERYFNQNQRMLASSQALRMIGAQNADTRARDVDRKEAADAQKQSIAWAKYGLEERGLQIKEYLKTHPHLQAIPRPGGNLILVNPETGVITDTGIPSGHPTAIQLADEQHKNRMKEINEQALNRIEAIQETGLEQRATQAAKPATAQRTGNVELEASRGIIRRAQEYANQHPEVADFITFTDKGVQVAPVAKSIFGGDPIVGKPFNEAQRKAAMDYIYGQTAPTVKPTTPTKVRPPTGTGIPGDLPASEVLTEPETHKIGDTKTFPNGNIGEWDGKGWVLKGKAKE